jgi:DNA-binding transcriptional LysR family regulator
LTLYLLIDAVRRFHAACPQIQVVLSTLTEQRVEQTLREDPELAFGVAAPYEPAAELHYAHLFSMRWSFVAPAASGWRCDAGTARGSSRHGRSDPPDPFRHSHSARRKAKPRERAVH